MLGMAAALVFGAVAFPERIWSWLAPMKMAARAALRTDSRQSAE
jgi:hypothetical protein